MVFVTEPFRLTEGEAEDSFELPSQSSTTPWAERVKQADGDAEAMWQVLIKHYKGQSADQVVGSALLIIAAELRAQRIAQRPGADR
jgi:hypothetical protein